MSSRGASPGIHLTKIAPKFHCQHIESTHDVRLAPAFHSFHSYRSVVGL